MRKIKTVIAIALGCAMTAGLLTGCGSNLGEVASQVIEAYQNQQTSESGQETESQTEQQTTEQQTTEQQTTEQQTTEQTASNDYLNYEHYDPTEFLANCDTLLQYAKNGETDKMNALYDEMYEEAAKIDQYYTVANILYSEDVTNTANKEESEYAYETAVDCEDAFCTAVHEITNTKSAQALKTHLNDDRMYNDYVDYEVMTDEQKELFNEERELENDYTELSDSFENYDQEENEKAGEIYLKLIKIREQIAESYGYDNYNDYCDNEVYARDYSESDLEEMKEAVKKFGVSYETLFAMLYYQLGSATTSTSEFMETEQELISGISPLVDNAWNNVQQTKTYSIGSESSREEGAYTTDLIASGEPFIYSKLEGSDYDYIQFTHEFGHYTESYNNDKNYWLLEPGAMDLFEIHSNGLELLSNVNMSSVFGDDAGALEAFNILFVVSNVVDGCIYDDFQRQVYDNPDWTLDQINECFKEVMLEYGATETEGMEYSWIAVSHNFTSPLYYISYATSAFAALQIFELAESDFESGVQAWEKIVSAGAYDDGYMTVVKDAGLSLFTDGDKVSEVLSSAYETAYSLSGWSSVFGNYGGSDGSKSYSSGDSGNSYNYNYNYGDSSDGSSIFGNNGNDYSYGSDGNTYYYGDSGSDEDYYEWLQEYLNEYLNQGYGTQQGAVGN